jgi:MFS family permease
MTERFDGGAAGSTAPDDAIHPSPVRRGRRVTTLGTFRSLRHRNYRLLWLGTVVSNSGDWMERIALNWLVWDLTHSAFSLALFNAVRLAPILLFTLVGGVVADRMERRRLMMTSQAAAMVLAFILFALVAADLITFWLVILLGAGRGVMLSFNNPARQSLISELVPGEDLMNAIALNSTTLNMTRIIGASVAGLLIGLIGVTGVFFINAVSFIAVLWALAVMQIPRRPARLQQTGVLQDMAGGMRYLWQERALLTLVMLALVPMVFGMPYQALLAIFADDVLNVGAAGYGILGALPGVGAVLGGLTVASLSGFRHRALLMFGGLLGFGAALVAFSASEWVAVSGLALLAVGWCQTAYLSTNNTLIQSHVADEFRGRVMSTLFLNRGMVPLGTMLAGLGSSLWGPQVTVGAMAAVIVVLAPLAAYLSPGVRRLGNGDGGS